MKLSDIENNVNLKLTFNFSIAVMDYCTALESDKKFVIAKQVLRSATSIGANATEAQNAESKADFIHKIKIAAKEAFDTQYWLMLCNHSSHYPNCEELLEQLDSINKVMNNIIASAKRNKA